jgi:hypothetical protein
MRNRAETPAPPNIHLVEHAAAPHLIAIRPAGSQIPAAEAYSLKDVARLPLMLPDNRHRYCQVIDRNLMHGSERASVSDNGKKGPRSALRPGD